MANRVTQLALDIAVVGAAAARLTWLSTEALVTGTASARLSWLSVEVLVGVSYQEKTVTADAIIGGKTVDAITADALLQKARSLQITATGYLHQLRATLTATGITYRPRRTVTASGYLRATSYSTTLTASAVLWANVLQKQVLGDALLAARLGVNTKVVYATGSLKKEQTKTVTATALLTGAVETSKQVTATAILVKQAHTLHVVASAELSGDLAQQDTLSQFFGRRF